jgi:hypothetical protein
MTLRERLMNSTVFAPASESAAAARQPEPDAGDNFRFDNEPEHGKEADNALDEFINKSDLPDDSQTQEGSEGDQGQQGQDGSQTGQDQSGTQQGTGTDKDGQQGQDQNKQASQAHGPQDLVLNDGTVIKGGAERRLYEKNQRIEGQLQQEQQERQRLANELEQARGQMKAYEQAFSSAQQYGISPQEANVGHRIVAAYKKDPVGTINYLLTEAKAAGHDVSAIGGSNVDTAAIQRAIEQKLKPITDQYRAQEEQTQQQREAEQEAQQFFQRYPDAATHENELSRLLERNPQMSPDAAYFALREYYARNGLDFRYPLSAYQQQRAQGGGQSGGQQTQQPAPSVPTGRGGAGNSAHTTYDPTKASSGNAEWDDIIGNAMRDAGLSTY